MKEPAVARRARVSTATVSRTFRNPEKVTERTRRRVRQAIRELGYVHNLEETLIAAFLGRRPDGFFLHGRHTPGAVQLLRSSGIPVVESGDLAGRPIDMMVSYSHFDAAKALTNHLIRKGYRRIALVCAPWRESERHYRRWRGYRAALQERGVAYRFPWNAQVHLPFSSKGVKKTDDIIRKQFIGERYVIGCGISHAPIVRQDQLIFLRQRFNDLLRPMIHCPTATHDHDEWFT